MFYVFDRIFEGLQILSNTTKHDLTRFNSTKQGVQTVKCLFTKQCLMVFGRQTFIVCPGPKISANKARSCRSLVWSLRTLADKWRFDKKSASVQRPLNSLIDGVEHQTHIEVGSFHATQELENPNSGLHGRLDLYSIHRLRFSKATTRFPVRIKVWSWVSSAYIIASSPCGEMISSRGAI